MGQTRNAKPIAIRKPADAERRRRIRRALGKVLMVLLVVAGAAAGWHFTRQYVEKTVTYPSAPAHVVIKNRPAWMSDFLAGQIERLVRPTGMRSTFDRQLLVDVTQLLRSSPWVREVRSVRRVYGQRPGDTIELDCEFRAPVALVRWGEYYWLTDGEGVKLPEQFNANQVPQIVLGNDRKTNMRIVEGVAHPPPESGKPWPGEDLAAGLDLVKLLFAQPYAEEIVKVNVSNFGGRRDEKEAHLVLMTRHGTEVRWGRPAAAKDYFIEVSAAQKLAYLRLVYEQKGRVDGGHPWIDIRFDAITYPSATLTDAAAGTAAVELTR